MLDIGPHPSVEGRGNDGGAGDDSGGRMVVVSQDQTFGGTRESSDWSGNPGRLGASPQHCRRRWLGGYRCPPELKSK